LYSCPYANAAPSAYGNAGNYALTGADSNDLGMLLLLVMLFLQLIMEMILGIQIVLLP
jgi:hypothetical protein